SLGLDVLLGDRRPKARATRTGLELGVRTEQRVATARAAVDALVVVLVIFAGKRTLGAFLAGDGELLGSQLLFPLLIGFDDLLCHDISLSGAGCVELDHPDRRTFASGDNHAPGLAASRRGPKPNGSRE